MQDSANPVFTLVYPFLSNPRGNIHRRALGWIAQDEIALRVKLPTCCPWLGSGKGLTPLVPTIEESALALGYPRLDLNRTIRLF